MTPLSDEQRSFLESTRTAGMITTRRDGTPHAVRIGIAVVDGKIWSSGTQARVRTKHLRRDPRSTLFVFDAGFRWLGLECDVDILDSDDAPELNLRLFQVMQPQASSGRLQWFGREVGTDEFLQIMKQEQRLIYQFNPRRAYGLVAAP